MKLYRFLITVNGNKQVAAQIAAENIMQAVTEFIMNTTNDLEGYGFEVEPLGEVSIVE